MEKKLKFLIVDDDAASAEIQATMLRKKGHETVIFTSSEAALGQITEIEPDCVLCDLLMPGLDGLDLFQQIRKLKKLPQPVFIIVTAKIYDFDKANSFKLGVSGYLYKPIQADTFVNEVENILEGTITIQFWGIRGSLPIPGKKTTQYGGNTNCVTLHFASNNQLFIFDAGTGIKELSNYLVKHHTKPIVGKIFISHPHYDHINGLPFFAPLYEPKNEFEIFGTNQGDLSIAKIISGQMDSIYFPITIKEFDAKLSFRNLGEEVFQIDDLQVKSMLLNHPGRCLGFRIEQREKSFCYITDNELYPKNSPHYNKHEEDRLVNFIKDADVLVIDTTYFDKDYLRKEGWGHSPLSRVIDIADEAKVKLLCLYHHDPDHFDKDITTKLKTAQAMLLERNSKTQCIAPKEGDKLIL